MTGLFLAFLFNVVIAGFDAWGVFRYHGRLDFVIELAVALGCSVWLLVLMARRA